jgi:GT2 family glycosyltransferase
VSAGIPEAHQDLSSITFFLVGNFTNADEKSFGRSIPRKFRQGGRISVVRSSHELLGQAIEQASTLFIAVVTTPLHFIKSGFTTLLNYADDADTLDVFYADSSDDLRPDFSPERLRCQNYFGELVVFRTALVRKIGGYRRELGLAAAYDLVLRATTAARVVCHVRSATYRTKSGTSRAGTPAFFGGNTYEKDYSRALREHLLATGGGHVVSIAQNGVFDTRRDVIGTPLISIVIPTRGTNYGVGGNEKALVIQAVRSIIDLTTYSNFEIVVVADAVADPAVLAQLSAIAGDRLRFVTWTKPFNFSEKMNFGVLHARGEFVLLLNDDVDVLSSSWLESMLALAQRPNAGMVGAMLYYGDDTIQHAGHAYVQGSPTHIGLGLQRGSTGPNSGYLVEREVSGVTAACALMPTTVFLDVGGFTALLPGNFNDVDLCLKVGWKGYDIYWTPHAELYHFESKTRDAHVHYYELDVIGRRWGLRLSDPRFWPGPASAAN